MSLSIERNGFTDITAMGFQIVKDLETTGFSVVAADKLDTDVYQATTNHYILEPDASVDPLIEDQPWRLMLEFNQNTGYINVWALTPTQIDDTNSPTQYKQDYDSGRLSLENSADSSLAKSFFWHRAKDKTQWSCYKPDGVDDQSIPLSYHLSVTDHGVFFHMWAESFDSAGDCFCWFVIQRPVDCNTGLVVSDGKAMLMCMFSRHGMDNINKLNNAVDSKVTESIQMFTVRESDINKPTIPVSAVVPTADNYPVINPIQQIALMEDSNYVIRMPQGFTTDRYIYDYKLDMIAYTSADVLSQWSRPSFTVFGEPAMRTYKALNANFPNNTGMRILCQTQGKGF